MGDAAELAQAGVRGLISFQPFGDLAADVCAATGDAPTVGVVFDQGPCQVARLSIDQAESGRLAGDAMGAFAAERWDCVVSSYVSIVWAATPRHNPLFMAVRRAGVPGTG